MRLSEKIDECLRQLKLHAPNWTAAIVAERKKAMRAIRLADSVMSYVSGDIWEREATQKQRNEFNKLYKELTGKEGSA